MEEIVKLINCAESISTHRFSDQTCLTGLVSEQLGQPKGSKAHVNKINNHLQYRVSKDTYSSRNLTGWQMEVEKGRKTGERRVKGEGEERIQV